MVHASVKLESSFGTGRVQKSPQERYSIPKVQAPNGNLNEACLRSHMNRLDFDSIEKFKAYTNYCELELKDLPSEVLALIEKVGELNDQVARVLNQDPAATFAMGVGITVSANVQGSMASEARGRVYLDGLPDWTIADFSSRIYAHEITHILMFNSGPTSDAFLGLQEHPLMIEALPDLISATVHDSPQMTLGEAGLPDCLRVIRDETPIRSFEAPFRHFYQFAETDDISKCCATLDLEKVTPFAKAICNLNATGKPDKLAQNETFVQENGITATSFTERNLSTSFEAENCRVTTKTGFVNLENCDTHQFAYPLVSFFFRLKELTGKSQVTAFIEKIRETVTNTAVYECGYAGATKTLGGAKGRVALRALLGAFIALRESLPSADQAAFDQAWTEHDFGKMVDLDRIYLNETLGGASQVAVKAKNPLYRDLHDCENIYKLDPIACQVVCEKKL